MFWAYIKCNLVGTTGLHSAHLFYWLLIKELLLVVVCRAWLTSLTSAGAETICLSRNCTCAKCVVRAKRELLRCSCSSSMLCSRSISSAWLHRTPSHNNNTFLAKHTHSTNCSGLLYNAYVTTILLFRLQSHPRFWQSKITILIAA